ncbi:MAG: class I SAM-dependent methyltransferase [Anaerolineae bacterium]
MRLWRQTVRFGFRLLYQEFAFTYDAVSWVTSMGAWRCWVESSLNHLPAGSPVLELAHGPGHLQVSLAERGVRAYGLDYSEQMGRQARKRLRGKGYPARLTRARAQALPFPAETFVAVVSTFPNEYISDPETLREVHRVLQSGAPLIIVPTASFTGGGIGKTALDWAYRATGQHDLTQPKRDRIAGLFQPYGFEVEVFEEPCPRSQALVVVARKSP